MYCHKPKVKQDARSKLLSRLLRVSKMR